jgi:hypothetical protein
MGPRWAAAEVDGDGKNYVDLVLLAKCNFL